MVVISASRIPGHALIEEIKNRMTIEDALCEYGKLSLTNKRIKGKSYNIRCPFHLDHSPSFSIWPQTNTWKCWAGCGSGDVINLASKFLDISNKEAILLLQKQLGIENNVSAAEISHWQEEREILQGFEETKEQIIQEIHRHKELFIEAMKQARIFEDIEKMTEVYHLMPMLDKYLEELNSSDIEVQVETVKYLKPIFLRGEHYESQ